MTTVCRSAAGAHQQWGAQELPQRRTGRAGAHRRTGRWPSDRRPASAVDRCICQPHPTAACVQRLHGRVQSSEQGTLTYPTVDMGISMDACSAGMASEPDCRACQLLSLGTALSTLDPAAPTDMLLNPPKQDGAAAHRVDGHAGDVREHGGSAQDEHAGHLQGPGHRRHPPRQPQLRSRS